MLLLKILRIAAISALSTALFSSSSLVSAHPASLLLTVPAAQPSPITPIVGRRQEGPPREDGNENITTTSDGTCLANADWINIDVRSVEGFFSCFSRSVGSDGTAEIHLSGVPNHVLEWDGVNPGDVCITPKKFTLPKPVKTENNTALPALGAIAIATNGVPMFGPADGGGENAISVGPVSCAGHPAMGQWHYHHPEIGCVTASSTTLVAWALDGFPIFGPLDGTKEDVDALLDDCNGLDVADSEYGYQYHVRTREQVDETLADNFGPNNTDNWKYFLGCYRGASYAQEASDSDGTCSFQSDDTTPAELVNTTNSYSTTAVGTNSTATTSIISTSSASTNVTYLTPTAY